MLEALYSLPAARIHLRELARRTGFSAPMVAKGLDRLLADELVIERREGRTRTFQANLRSPLAEDIRRIACSPTVPVRRSRKRLQRVVSAAHGHDRPSTLAEAARQGAAYRRRDALLREFLDAFYKAPSAKRAAMLSDEPALDPHDDRANAYYAAVAEHLALSNRLPIPQWDPVCRAFRRRRMLDHVSRYPAYR